MRGEMEKVNALKDKQEMTSSFDFDEVYSVHKWVKMWDGDEDHDPMTIKEIAMHEGVSQDAVRRKLNAKGVNIGLAMSSKFKSQFEREWREVTAVLRLHQRKHGSLRR